MQLLSIIPFLKNNLSLSNSLSLLLVAFALVFLDVLIFRFGISKWLAKLANSKKWINKNINAQQGFTLIELMITLAIFAILTTIAVPSYQRYLIKNNEALAQKKMLTLSNELEAWRVKSFTYNGFVPKDIGSQSGGADNKVDTASGAGVASNSQQLGNNKHTYIINVPNDKDSAYKIELTLPNARSWIMVAKPVASYANKSTNYYMLTSSGIRCFNNIEVKSGAKDCGVGQQTW